MGEQRLVDRVLAFDRHHRDPGEAQLLVQRDRGVVVVRHREVHVGAAPVPIEGTETAGQRGAHTGNARRGVHGQRPQARAVLGVGEQRDVVDAGHGAQHGVVVVTHGDQVIDGRLLGVVLPDVVNGRGHHPAAHVDAVHRVRVLAALQGAHAETVLLWPGVLALAEPQPIRVARVDEQLGGRLGHQDMGFARVDADVAAAVALLAQHLGQLLGVGERLPENEPAPTEFENHVIGHRGHHTRRGGLMEGQRHRLGVVVNLGVAHAAGPLMPCRCSHNSSSAICQSSLPRRGVSFPLGSASSRSTASGRNSPRSLAAGAYSASRTMSR